MDSPDARHFSQLREEHKISIVLSLDNLIEFSQSSTVDQAVALTRSALSCSPKWIDTFIDIQKQEMRQFIFTKYMNKTVETYSPYQNKFTKFFNGKPVSPVDFVIAAFDPLQKEKFKNKHEEHARVLGELKDHTKNNKFTKAINDMALNNLIVSKLPQQELDLLGFTLNDKRDLVSFCLENRSFLYKACPSLNTERHLSDYRSANPNRNPRLSDSIDLTMSSATFTYVDVFVTNDGFLHDGLQYVSKKAPSINTKLFRKIHEYKFC